VSWIRQVLKDLFVFLPQAPLLLCDNQSALQLAKNPIFHGRTKHVEIDFHFVREKVVSNDLQLRFVPTQQQPADLFTKPMSTDRLSSLRCKLMPSTAFV
ncbi:MAG: Ty1/Copia family ribonuclease HI, partial [Sweet potato little leaf phytoplasma]|nr:Ty1/Copia family ribonuclease HI [Sweet potato little leaf phytoplasma]